MMDCKKALAEAGGDLEQAIILLRKRGTAVAERKAGRVTSEGSVASYIHAGGKIGKLGENIAVRRFARFKVGEAGMTVAATSQKPDDGGEAAAPVVK